MAALCRFIIWRVIMNKRKVKLKDGEVESFWYKENKNPCGCGSNVFHKELEGIRLFGVCNACDEDLYEFSYEEDYIENSEWSNNEPPIENKKYNVSFEYIKGICKHKATGYEDGNNIATCRNENNIPKGCSWGKCNEEMCPVLKEGL
jgi:hypothetical protein